MNTNNWKLDLFASLDSADSLQAIMSASLDAIRPFGFDYCSWRTDLPTHPIAKNDTITAFTTVEDEVYATTIKGGYEDGPVPRHCTQSFAPISWRGTFDEDVFKKSPEIMEKYYGLGHKGGWAVATLFPDSTRGMFYVESRNVFSLSEMNYAEQHMQWVSAATCMRLCEIQSKHHININKFEIEVLKNLAYYGGNIQKVSEKTKKSETEIFYLVESLKDTLGCTSIYGLISYAIFLKIIS